MMLVFPNGRTLPLTAAAVVRLGRKDMLESTYAASISREQCSLSRSESGGVKLVRAHAPQPTARLHHAHASIGSQVARLHRLLAELTLQRPVRLTSSSTQVTLGQNPTRLVRANGEVKLLRRGEDSQLQVGDKVRACAARGGVCTQWAHAHCATRSRASELADTLWIPVVGDALERHRATGRARVFGGGEKLSYRRCVWARDIR